jgi:hypothetical protein
MDNSNVQRLGKLREQSFALDEDLDKIVIFIKKMFKTEKISKVNKIIDSLISETKDTKENLFNLLIKDQHGENYEQPQQALVLFNFTNEIESKLYLLKDCTSIHS